MVTLASAAGGGVGLLFLVIVGLAIYLLPTIVAMSRKVVNVGSVAVINIAFGWTLVGWVVAMAMAARTNPVGSTVNVNVAQDNTHHAPAAPGAAGTPGVQGGTGAPEVRGTGAPEVRGTTSPGALPERRTPWA